jgi:hypothetical protein
VPRGQQRFAALRHKGDPRASADDAHAVGRLKTSQIGDFAPNAVVRSFSEWPTGTLPGETHILGQGGERPTEAENPNGKPSTEQQEEPCLPVSLRKQSELKARHESVARQFGTGFG